MFTISTLKHNERRFALVVIPISGKAQHGKDTTAGFIKEELEERSNAKVLLTHYADLLKYICREYLDWNGEKDEDGRTLLQHVGTDVIRKQRPDFWVEFVLQILEFFNNRWDYVLIPDARFPNEVDLLKGHGFDVIHLAVYRPNFDGDMSEGQKSHISEVAMNDIKPDFYIRNDGSLEDLKAETVRWIKENLNNAE